MEEGLDFVKLNLGQLDEISDIVGFPVKEFQISKTTSDGNKTKWVTEMEAERAIKDPTVKLTGLKRTTYCPPEWIAGKSNGGILLLDDFTRGSQAMMQAVMDLIYTQEYYSWTLPKDWHICLTSNPDNGNYHVTSLDGAQTSRFISCNLKFDVNCWAEWAESANIDGRAINFVLKHREIIGDKTNPRSITTFFNSISSFKNFEDNLPMIQMIGEGSIGPEVTTLFTMFIHNKLDKLVSPEDLMKDSVSAESVVEQLRDAIGEGADYRADIASILATRIVNYSVNFSKSNKVTDNIIKKLESIITQDVLTIDLKYMFVRNLMKDAKQKFQKLLLNADVLDITTK